MLFIKLFCIVSLIVSLHSFSNPPKPQEKSGIGSSYAVNLYSLVKDRKYFQKLKNLETFFEVMVAPVACRYGDNGRIPCKVLSPVAPLSKGAYYVMMNYKVMYRIDDDSSPGSVTKGSYDIELRIHSQWNKVSEVVFVLAFVGLSGLRGMVTHVGRLDTLIACMALTNLRDVVDGLRASHISMLHQRVVVVSGLRQFQDIGRHVSPAVSIAPVAPCQSHGVADMVGSAVIAGQYKVRALIVLPNVRERLLELGDVLGCCSDIALWVVELVA